jgi:hypothetical protein
VDASETGLIERAQAAFMQVQASLSAEERAWLTKVPLIAAIDALDAQPPGLEFTEVSPEVEAVDAAAVLQGGPEWVGTYWNLVLLELVVRTLRAPTSFQLPPQVQRLRV